VPTWNDRDAVFEMLGLEKLMHNPVGLVLVTHPNLKSKEVGLV
jgi:hypothetical protein